MDPNQKLSLIASFTATAAAQSGDFTYTSSNGEVTITGYFGTGGSVVIPGLIAGLPVVAVGTAAFSGMTSLTSVAIADGIRKVGSSAFSGCGNLTTISIPNTVTSIDSFAFSGCSRLASLTIPNGVKTISSFLLNECTSLTRVTLPEALTGIGSSAFRQCVALTQIVIPSTVTSIGDLAFNVCRSLTSISVPASVSSIGESAFLGLSSLLSISVDAANQSYATTNGVLYDKSITTLIQCPAGKGGVVSVPGSVTNISANAFFACEGVTSVSIPNSVTSIGRNAFRQCRSLTSLNIPSGVTIFEEYVFFKCTNLASITIPSSVTSIGQFAFYECNALTGINLPAQVSRIGDFAFAGCNTLSGVSIPASVTSVGSSTFLSCNNMMSIHVEAANPIYTSIDGVLFNKTSTTLIRMPGGRSGAYAVPSGITTVAARAFYDCARLTSVTIPTSVMRLEDLAFAGCNGLTSVNIPSSVTSVLGSTFRSCSSLVSIVVDSDNPSYASVDGVLFNKSLTTLLRCPGGKSGNYPIPLGVTSVQAYAFYECFDLASVAVPATVATIGTYAFSRCGSMTSIDVDAANETYASSGGLLYDKAIGLLITCPEGFSGGVDIPASVTAIRTAAFYGCNGVLRVSVPAGVTSVGSSAFNSCVRLQAVYFYGNQPTISTEVFTDTPVTVYRLIGTTGWAPLVQDVAVRIFQVCDVPSGQSMSALIDRGVERFLKKGSGTAILSGSSVHSDGTVIEEGEVVVQNKSAFGLGSLEVLPGARVSMQVGSETVKVTAISLGTTSRVDVGTGRIRVAANGYTEADIRANLIAGRNRGSWNGATGIRSTVAGSDGSRAIGYRVTSGEMEVAFAAPGDSNLDGVVDILDLSEILGGGKFNTGASANWEQGDTNYDGVFDILDISAIIGTGLFNQGSYLTQASASSAAVGTGTVATFDPALVFAALAAEPTTLNTTKRKCF